MTSIREFIQRFFTQVKPLPTGLYHYQTPAETNKPYRLHLRLEPDGNGLLIVNASTILHLNQTAAEIAYHIVRGTPAVEAIQQIASRYRVSHKIASQDYQELIDRIQNLITTPDLDPEIFFDFERIAPSTSSLTAPYRLDCALTYRLPEGVKPAYAPIDRATRELSTQEWLQLIDKAWEAGIPQIIFTGGEPTLRDDLPELLAYAEKNGQVTGLITNGLIFSEPEKLDALLQTGLDHVLITLQPDNPISWTAIENVISVDLFVAVHFTLSIQNIVDAGDFVVRLAQLGVKHLSLSSDDVSLQQNLIELRNLAASLGMSLIWDLPVPYSAFNPVALEIQEDATPQEGSPRNLYVEPDGDVLPAQNVKLVLGNMLSDPWDKIWQ